MSSFYFGKRIALGLFFCFIFTDGMDKLSVVIITFNEEKNIGRCLDSVKQVADEIVVLDSFSTDRTREICLAKGARFFQHPFDNYTAQKNQALDFATYRYVLNLDADEAIDKKLEQSILKAKQQFDYDGYFINRCTWYCGKFIRHGNWYPDRKLRLFNKEAGRWGGHRIHEVFELKKPAKTSRLRGDILHYSYHSLAEHLEQRERFSTLTAQSYFEQGKKARWYNLYLNPAWNFISGYFLRLGFLDGKAGFLIARISAGATYLKYKKLLALYRDKKN